jgi:hypothetical protein
MRTLFKSLAVGSATLVLASAVLGQEPASPPSATQPYVTWQEYQRVLNDQAEMRTELEALKKQLATQPAAPAAVAQAPTAAPTTAPAESTAPTNDELEAEIQSLKDASDRSKPGMENVVIAGDAATGFTTQKGAKSSFYGGVSPLILWQPTDRFLFETAFDINIGTDPNNNSSTSLDLSIADASFILNDYMLVGGGLFTTPFGQYHNHFDPPWITKFPDDPLAFGAQAIAPEHAVGAFVKGAIPISTTKVTYDLYVSNGPNLVTNTNAGTPGQLNFDEFSDLNNNKAVGGRISFLPFPDMEMGYSAMGAQVNTDGFPKTYAVLQAVDFNYRPVVDSLGGQFDLQAEWVWSNVDRQTYDPTGSQGIGPINFNNDRNGGYVELTYRATKSDIELLRNLEYGVRYDRVSTSLDAPGADRESRYTIGLDYWITPTIVLQSAYEFDFQKPNPNANAFLVQLGIGL